MVDNTQAVQNAINAIQFRTVSTTDPTFLSYVAALNNGQSISFVANLISTDNTATGGIYTRANVNPVVLEYQAAFGRVPDQAGQSFWVNQFATNPSALANISTTFANSMEFGARYNGANASTTLASDGLANFTLLVTNLYTNVLQRPPDTAGLNFWVNSGNNAGQLLQQFATNDPEFLTNATPHILAFQQLEVAGTEPTSGSLFIVPIVPGFTLTPNIDTFSTVATGVTFTALPFVQTSGLANNTLNTGDNLQDTSGDGTLNYTASPNGVAANPPFALGVTVNGVKTASISNQAAGIVGGFQGTVTGLDTVNDTASVFGVRLGGVGQGLNTVLTNVTISGYGGPNTNVTPVFNGIIAASKGSATNTINVGITGPLGATTKAGADALQFTNDGGPGTAANPNLSYGTWAITTANAVDLQLQQGGVGAAAALKLSGAGNIAVGQDAIGNWQNVKDINASGETGTVIVTGATAGNATNAHGTGAGAATANPLWLFGSTAGLLDDTGTAFNLTTYELGSGTNIVDVSSATATQVAALATTPNTTASLTNTIIVQDSVATTTSATTFAGIKGFQTLGIGGPTIAQGAAGTIDLTKLPASIGTIDYFTKANGSVTINNQTTALTVNLEDNTTIVQNLTVGAVGPAAGLTDSLSVSVGNALHKGLPGLTGGDAFNDITANGDEVFMLTSVGGGAVAAGVGNGANDLGGVLLFPTLGGNEQVKITGDTTLQMAVTHSALGAIQDQNSTFFLNLNNLSVTDTNTAATEWGQGIAAPSKLFFATDANPTVHAPIINYSNNAVSIDATTSGGLISPWGDANFAPGGTVATSFGDNIKGATTPVGYQTGGAASLALGDVLGGSIGNDIITSQSVAQPDYLVTGGGSDTINLAAGHSAADHVAFYAGAGNVNAGGAYAVGSVATAISEAVGGLEFVNPGWWGIGAGGASKNIDTLATGSGTTIGNSDNSTINGFVPTQDVLDFSTKAWGTGALVNGLTADNGALIHVGAGLSSATGTAVNVKAVAPGDSIAGPAGTPTDLIVLSQGTFLDGNAVAGALVSSYNVLHSAAAAVTDYDFLLVYQGLDNNAHLADLHIEGAGTHTGTGVGVQDTRVNVSDIATLVGVNVPQLITNATHVHIVT